MSVYEIMQIAAAGVVILLSLWASNGRGAVWICAILLDMMLSTWAWTSGHPYAAVITAACDFTLCIAIYQFGRNRWEQWLFLLYQFSMLTSIFAHAASIFAPGWMDHDTYSSILEAVNYSAFLLIGTISGIHIASDREDILALRPWRRIRALVLPSLREDP